MNHRIVATLGAFVLLLLTAVPALGHDAIASCGTIQLVNGTATADVTRTDVDPDALVRDDIPGTGTQAGLAAGTYRVVWDDGFTVAGIVVTACEQVTQPTPTPTPTPTPPEVQLCDGPCPTPPDQRYPCTSNPAVFGPPCPEPTTSPTPSPTPTPTTSPSPSSSPSPTPNLSVTPSPDVPTITPPATETGAAPVTDSNTIVGLVFVIAAMAGVLVAVWPRRAR